MKRIKNWAHLVHLQFIHKTLRAATVETNSYRRTCQQTFRTARNNVHVFILFAPKETKQKRQQAAVCFTHLHCFRKSCKINFGLSAWSCFATASRVYVFVDYVAVLSATVSCCQLLSATVSCCQLLSATVSCARLLDWAPKTRAMPLDYKGVFSDFRDCTDICQNTTTTATKQYGHIAQNEIRNGHPE
jgi:hypothetical protein